MLKMHSKLFFKSCLVLEFATQVTPALATDWFAKKNPQVELQAAHEAYLEGDLDRTILSVKEALKSKNEDVRANAMELWKQTLVQHPNERQHADWSLPADVTKMVVNEIYSVRPDDDGYEMRVKGDLAKSGALTQLQLIRYPSEVILDKNAGVGRYTETINGQGKVTYELKRDRQRHELAEGLYLLNITTSDGKLTQGWFIMANLAATAAPRIQTPANGESFSTGSPTFKWDDFRSPQYQPSESRIFYLWINDKNSTSDVDLCAADQDDPTITQLTVGKDAGEGCMKSLPPGDYYLGIIYGESRKFGDISLRRSARSVRLFHIKPKS